MGIKLNKIKKPFIIAELSANHNGKINNIYRLINKAKNFGANAIKIQSYTAESMTIDCKNKYFYINKGPWKGNYLNDLYKKVIFFGNYLKKFCLLHPRLSPHSNRYYLNLVKSI